DKIQELPVSELLLLALFSSPDVCNFVSASGSNLPVKAVVSNVALSPKEPLEGWVFPFKHFCPWLEPFQFPRNFLPESLRELEWFKPWTKVFEWKYPTFQ